MTNILDDKRFFKLPKWVQDTITGLINRNRFLQKENHTLNNQQPQSNTYYRLCDDMTFTKHYLPEGTHLTTVGKGTQVSMFVDHNGQIRIDIGYG